MTKMLDESGAKNEKIMKKFVGDSVGRKKWVAD